MLGIGPATPDRCFKEADGVADTVHGVLITDTDEDSDAFSKGLRKGDVIVRAGDGAVTKPADVVGAVAAAKKLGRTAILLLVSHNGSTIYVPVKIENGAKTDK